MNDVETAWVAGVMEGEGYFVLTSLRPPRKDGRPSRRVVTAGVKMLARLCLRAAQKKTSMIFGDRL